MTVSGHPLCTTALIGFDTETTGVDVENDRIVEASVILMEAGGTMTRRHFLINPGIPIPKDASDVHGITNERVQAEGLDPVEALSAIRAKLAFGGLPVVAFNAAFDLTLFDRECRRHGIDPFLPAHVVDPFVIDKHLDPYRKGPRKLEPMAAHYGVRLENAHTAEADTTATLLLARALGAHPGLPEDLDELTRAQAVWYREQKLSFQAYLRKRQPPGQEPVVLDTQWPMIPFAERGQVAA